MSDIAKIDYTPLAADNQIHRTAFERYGGRRIIGIVREVIGMRLSTSDTDALWRAFAVANGWQVEEVQDLTLIPLSLMYGHIEYGRRRSCSPAVKADLCGIQAGILVYSSVVYGRACSVTVARVPLPKALPHILLRAKGEVSMLAADIGDHEKLRLEGDFDNYFTR